MLSAAGYKTGLYTSPHLVHFEERIRIDGRQISREAVAGLTSRLAPMIKKHHPTFFEATTAIAFAYFAQEEVDVAVIETGLGGRLDSTNIVHPLVSVITTIGLEHTEILGNTLKKISAEKAGIIKRKVPCVTGIQNKAALSVVRHVCKERNAPLILGTKFEARVKESSLRGTLLDFKAGKVSYEGLKLSLPGPFQVGNLGVALATIDVLNNSAKLNIDEVSIRAGLSNIQGATGLSGRLSIINETPLIISDVAHNSDAIRNLCDTWKRLKLKRPIVVFGVVRDKDYSSMVSDLALIAERAVAVAASNPRSRPASDVAAAFEREECRTQAALSVEEGMRLAQQMAGSGGTILVTGSHFVVGEAMAALGRKRP